MTRDTTKEAVMTPTGDQRGRSVVTPLRRPPVRQSVGGYSSGGYAIGWARILGCFAATLGTGAADEEGIRDER
jgi:hypothetical protein